MGLGTSYDNNYVDHWIRYKLWQQLCWPLDWVQVMTTIMLTTGLGTSYDNNYVDHWIGYKLWQQLCCPLYCVTIFYLPLRCLQAFLIWSTIPTIYSNQLHFSNYVCYTWWCFRWWLYNKYIIILKYSEASKKNLKHFFLDGNYIVMTMFAAFSFH